MKVPPTTVIRFANLPSLVFPGKNKVGYFLDRPRIQMSTAKTPRQTPGVWGVSFILYNVGDSMEPCGTLAFMSLGIDISPSTMTEFSLRKRKSNTLN
jgi:hypothetical protein